MSHLTSEELQKRREEFQNQAGEAFDQMLGRTENNGLVTINEREERACDLGDALTRRLLEEQIWRRMPRLIPAGKFPVRFAAGRCIVTRRKRWSWRRGS